MAEAILTVILSNLFEVVASIISILVAYYVLPWVREQMIPWLIEKRLYNIVAIGVQAAEKLAQSEPMSGVDKKMYVVKYLQKKGIKVTPEVETFIESVCQELDTIAQATVNAFEVPVTTNIEG